MSLLPYLRSLAFCALFSQAAFASPTGKDWSSLSARRAPAWVRDTVVYEIFPRQFSATGDFAGITARLDELQKLGVEVLWLMPIHPLGKLKAKGSLGSPYAVRDYYAVNPDYGTKEDFRRLVHGAHQRGLKVIIDIVANHTAWDSVLMAKPSYYKRNAAGEVIPPHPDWQDVAGLDYTNPETCTYMREMLKYWVRDFDLDGYRCDVAGEVPTAFWEQVREDLDQLKPGLFLLAEASKPELLVKAFDADYAWPLLGTLNRVLMDGAPASEIRRCWEKDEGASFPKGALHLRCSDNHDEPRAVARFGWKGALAVSALLCTLDGIPLLYNGMEVGDATESGDPALFEKVPVFWQPKHRGHFPALYRQLLALRREHKTLSTAAVTWLENSRTDTVLSFARFGAKEGFVVVVNLSNRPVEVQVVGWEQATAYTPVLSPETKDGALQEPLPKVKLGAFDWRIYKRDL